MYVLVFFVFRGYKSALFLRIYALVVGLADLVQVIALLLFTIPEARNQTFDAVHLNAEARDNLTKYSTIVGSIFAVVVILQLFALCLVLLRCSSLSNDDHYDSDTEESGLLRSYKPGTAQSPRNARPSAAKSSATVGLGGLLEEEARPTQPRLTYSSLYDKYSRR